MHAHLVAVLAQDEGDFLAGAGFRRDPAHVDAERLGLHLELHDAFVLQLAVDVFLGDERASVILDHGIIALGFFADSQDLIGFGVNRDNAWLVDDDPLTPYVYQCIGGTKIDTDIVGKPPQQLIKHAGASKLLR